MSLLRTPLLSFGARGKLGKEVTFHRWKGKKQIQKYATPTNPRTAAQQANRNRLKVADLFWTNSTHQPACKEGWQRYTQALRKKGSGYSTFMSPAMKALPLHADPAFALTAGTVATLGAWLGMYGLNTYSWMSEPGNFRLFTALYGQPLKFHSEMPLQDPGVIAATNLGNYLDWIVLQVFKDGLARSGIVKKQLVNP